MNSWLSEFRHISTIYPPYLVCIKPRDPEISQKPTIYHISTMVFWFTIRQRLVLLKIDRQAIQKHVLHSVPVMVPDSTKTPSLNHSRYLNIHSKYSKQIYLFTYVYHVHPKIIKTRQQSSAPLPVLLQFILRHWAIAKEQRTQVPTQEFRPGDRERGEERKHARVNSSMV